jgi:hypothetical protein
MKLDKKTIEAVIEHIEEMATECDAGRPVFHFDVRDTNVGATELKRHGMRLRELVKVCCDCGEGYTAIFAGIRHGREDEEMCCLCEFEIIYEPLA